MGTGELVFGPGEVEGRESSRLSHLQRYPAIVDRVLACPYLRVLTRGLRISWSLSNREGSRSHCSQYRKAFLTLRARLDPFHDSSSLDNCRSLGLWHLELGVEVFRGLLGFLNI